ncbi:FtsX-like permease family protein [Clostridium frigidicarnis]|uniref:Putative ABC transport system permease protein n=1 Tax=Clostridium frigidicarnis TaxID=84698 RepID=A0A1I0X994_9CLOT|nr:FtsX-like permease family protein [Clostridium frigidicarnis]SFA97247.1 putative ABC transport system permease protein [Clostridium frigidicarnis]
MYSRLALRNMKRSLKDYTIYFLTLVFGVCIFYTFNSIESQKVMMEVNSYQESGFEMISKVMEVASVFISFILGFLIIYANGYLIKRRKKEFGVYMTLGMEKRSISKILFMETIIIGLISLGIGLILGMFLSQGLSILTAKMFQTKLTSFKFIFSKSACVKTIGCFGLIYIVVFLFNSISIGKINLIDLITSSRKNQKVTIKNIWVSFIIFILSITTLGIAYYMVLKQGVAELNGFNLIPIILGCIGTFLFFFSLSGFLLKIAQSNKKSYLKDLNMFVLRQINSKINTTFISMTFICLMIFFAICTLSAGLGVSKSLNNDIKDLTQFDVTLTSNIGNKDIEKALKESNLDINKYAEKYVKYCTYGSNIGFKDFFTEDGMKKGSSFYPVATNQSIPVIKLSDFNNIMRMIGKAEIKLNKHEYASYTNATSLTKIIQESLDRKTKININGPSLDPSKNKVIEVTTSNSTIKNANDMCVFIVEDSAVDGLNIIKSSLNLNFKGDKLAMEKGFNKEVKGLIDRNKNTILVFEKEVILASSTGIGVVVSYLAIYIGVIFLITSAAVLALQQLSESADNIERYKLLRKIGVDDKMINKSILTQVGIYFMMPLSLAIVHSIVGLKIVSNVVSVVGNENIIKYILITSLILLTIYGGYFAATYNGAKKMVKS